MLPASLPTKRPEIFTFEEPQPHNTVAAAIVTKSVCLFIDVMFLG